MNALIKRLEEVRHKLHLGKKEFAEAGGSSPQNYSNWIANKTTPPLSFVITIKNKWPHIIDLDYLLNGQKKQTYPSQVSEEKSGYNSNTQLENCVEKLGLYEELLRTKNQLIDELKRQVSEGVSKKAPPKS